MTIENARTDLNTRQKSENLVCDLNVRMFDMVGLAGLNLISLYGQSSTCPWGEDKNDGSLWLRTYPQIIQNGECGLRVHVFSKLNKEDNTKVDLIELRGEDDFEKDVMPGNLLYSTDGITNYGPDGDVLTRHSGELAAQIALAFFLEIQRRLMSTRVAGYRVQPLEWA